MHYEALPKTWFLPLMLKSWTQDSPCMLCILPMDLHVQNGLCLPPLPWLLFNSPSTLESPCWSPPRSTPSAQKGCTSLPPPYPSSPSHLPHVDNPSFIVVHIMYMTFQLIQRTMSIYSNSKIGFWFKVLTALFLFNESLYIFANR